MLALNIALMLATFLFMEFVAWFTHKYVMHGLLWVLHRDHHQKDHDSFWERNDVHTPWAGAGHYAIYMRKAIEPMYQCRHDIDIFADPSCTCLVWAR